MSLRKTILAGMLCLCILLLPAMECMATPVRSNEETDYKAILFDGANLFTDSEVEELLDIMYDSTKYGNVYLLTVSNHNYYSTYHLAEGAFEEAFGYENGVIFVIDMQERMLWITGMDETQYVITDNYCDTITDNVYTYASDGDYFTCSKIAFEQIYAVLEGKDIPMPMKYICNFLLSVAIALLVNYFIASSLSKKRVASEKDIRRNMSSHFQILNPQATYTHQTKHYRSSSSSSSGGSSGGGGGGGSSGGGHSF